MALIEVIKYNSANNELCWKFPVSDLKLGAQLVVRTSQKAFFVKGGKICDEFDSGTYTLKSANLPLLNKFINLPFGGESPFQAEVWFVNLTAKLDCKWGTPVPIQLEDPKYGLVLPIRAFGQYGIKINNARLFLETLVGTLGSYDTNKTEEYFTGKVISSISSSIAKKLAIEKVSFLEVAAYLNQLSTYCGSEIAEEFKLYGIELVNFFFISINTPDDDSSIQKLKEAKEKAMYLKTLGKDVYSFDRSMDVLNTAAANEGTSGNIMGAGMGLGMGFGIGGAMGNQFGNVAGQMNSNLNTNTPPPIVTTQYFVYINNSQKGPLTLNQIQELIQKNELTRETLTWKSGMENWQKSSDVSEINVLFNNTPPPIPNV